MTSDGGGPLKYLIDQAQLGGMPVETVTLLLLLPLVAVIIAASRHLIGLRGFGIFLPAALTFVFTTIGPLVGIGLFLVIVALSTGTRLLLRRLKIKLQYLPRMSLILWAVVLGVMAILFLIPYLPVRQSISIFPVLILILLAEDFNRVQLGKSARVAVSLTSETVVLALISYLVLQSRTLQNFALSDPEIFLILILVVNIFLGRYSGLRVIEFWRFRRLLKS